jgi:tryptophan halogenase
VETQAIKKIVIAGGGTAGWAAASALSKQLGPLLDMTLVESEALGTVGVGEATIPPMRVFHRLAGVEEREFMQASQATFKLGIQFEDWGRIGDKYIHSFGQIGKGTWLGDFHHFWLHAKSKGFAGSLDDYCFELLAAREGKFQLSDKGQINYAYHLDATRYARFLRDLCEARGVKRIEGKIEQVTQNADTGFIETLVLDDGRVVEGDLFIDCTGFRSILIEQTLKTGYEDWAHWLPTDSAFAVQTASTGPAMPYTRSIARTAGWQWRIPLQHRVGNGLVYSSHFLDEDRARDELLANLDGQPLTEPRLIRYRTGRRLKAWNKNCVALGLSSGFLEPLESTSIHLMMIGVTRLIQLFPFNGITESVVNRYNALSKLELERIRDFIILHYKLTERDDTPFWEYCKHQEVPKSLSERLALFEDSAHIYQAEGDLFQLASWLQVMLGQGLEPKGYHHVARLMPAEQLKQSLSQLRETIARVVAGMPPHQAFVEKYCKAPTP